MTDSRERRAQKARTREAILAAARALIAEGTEVTVTAAARRANVSKATAYRYFSDPKVLAAEAGLAVEVAPFESVVANARDTRERVLAVSRYVFDLSHAHEAAFRQFLARNLDAWLSEGGAPRERRGARRVAMFEAALEDVRERLSRQDFEQLVLALTAATGTEAMIALLDVARTDPDRARRTVEVIAEALLERYLGGH